MRAAYQLDKLDLSKLTQQEKELLEKTNSKPNIAWPTSIGFIAIQSFLVISIYIKNTDTDSNHLINLAVVGAGYLALGFWARSWSRLAIFLLLCWHVFWYRNLATQSGMGIMMLFWWPVLTYVFGIISAGMRLTAVRKATVQIESNP